MLNDGFPRELAARANTTLNLLMFGGSFLAQWGIGVSPRGGAMPASTARGPALAFAAVLAFDVAGARLVRPRAAGSNRAPLPAVAVA